MKKIKPAVLAASTNQLRITQPERLSLFEEELARTVGGLPPDDDAGCTKDRTCCGLDSMGRMMLDDC